LPDISLTQLPGPFIDRRRSKLLRSLYALLHWGLIDLDLRMLIRRVAQLMTVAFSGIILVSWVNEIYDLPYLMRLSGPSEPSYYSASIETLWAFFVLLLVLVGTRALLKQIRYLEGFLPVCSFCKMIRLDDGIWVPVERYLQERSAVKMTHSLCPGCAKKHYGYGEDVGEGSQGGFG
jgi:hypothetical protein